MFRPMGVGKVAMKSHQSNPGLGKKCDSPTPALPTLFSKLFPGNGCHKLSEQICPVNSSWVLRKDGHWVDHLQIRESRGQLLFVIYFEWDDRTSTFDLFHNLIEYLCKSRLEL